MPQIAGNNVIIDRESNAFDIQVNYTIPGYNDPESGEYFGDTSWTATYGAGYSGGYAGESDSPTINLGFGGGDSVHSYAFSFFAQNTFSAVSYTFDLNVFEGALSTVALNVTGTGGMDLFITGSGNDTVQGLGGDDTFDLGAGNDMADGGEGSDYLDGGAGDDTLTGGAGDDIYIVDSVYDVVVELPGGGYDTIYASTTVFNPANVEQIVLTGTGGWSLYGNDQDNRLIGNDGNNRLVGNKGNDFLFGGDGRDTLEGGEGNDYLEGGLGSDRLFGGKGDDTYRVTDELGQSFADLVVENPGEGTDTVRSARANYQLGTNFENLVIERAAGAIGKGNVLVNVITGFTGADRLYGLAGDDRLEGGGGNDILVGGIGADVLIGGAGSDTASYADAASGVEADLGVEAGLSGEALGDNYDSIENLIGSAFADILTGKQVANVLQGGAGDDVLTGWGGDDTLVGGAGADTLIGGDGIDTVSYRDALTAVFVDIATQVATGGDANADVLSGFENAEGGAGNDLILGDGGANELRGLGGSDTLRGLDGNDTIEGGAGADVLDGGTGKDWLTYQRSSAGVVIHLGLDVAQGGDAEGDSFTGFENLMGSAYGDVLIGDETANSIYGRAGADTLLGGGGDDSIQGGAGADAMDGGEGRDTLSYLSSSQGVNVSLDGFAYGGDASGDTFQNFEDLRGSAYRDVLWGNARTNVLNGGAGNDWLDGQGGSDTLIGGEGRDTFGFRTGGGRDRVSDFDADDDFLYIEFDGITSASQVLALGQDVGGNAVFTFANNTVLTLSGVALASLGVSNFVFPDPELL